MDAREAGRRMQGDEIFARMRGYPELASEFKRRLAGDLPEVFKP